MTFGWSGDEIMRLPRTFIIAVVIALIVLATVGFGKPLGDSDLREDAAVRQNIVLTAVTADVTPLSHGVLPPLGPIPCPDGSTVDFGQFCPLPNIQCANGATVPFGQFCPAGQPGQAAPAQGRPTTLSDLFKDVNSGLQRLRGESQKLGPTTSSAGDKFSGTNLQADQSTFDQWTAEKSGMRVFFQQGTVAPTSFGVVDLLIPWDHLSDLLKPGVLQQVTS
jgi:hypothetical protein